MTKTSSPNRQDRCSSSRSPASACWPTTSPTRSSQGSSGPRVPWGVRGRARGHGAAGAGPHDTRHQRGRGREPCRSGLQLRADPDPAVAARRDGGRRHNVLEVGLWAFAAVGGLAAVVVAAQALRRRMAETTVDLPSLRAMGLTSSQCAIAVTLTVLPLTAVGGRAHDAPLHRGLCGDAHRRGSSGRAVARHRCGPARGRSRRARADRRFSRPASSSVPCAWVGPVRRTLQRSGRAETSASLLASGRFSPATQLGGPRWRSTPARAGPPSPSGRRSWERSLAWPESWARQPSAPGSISSSRSRARAAGTGRSHPTSPRRT